MRRTILAAFFLAAGLLAHAEESGDGADEPTADKVSPAAKQPVAKEKPTADEQPVASNQPPANEQPAAGEQPEADEKSATEKLMDLYGEYEELSDKMEEERPVSGVQLVADFLTDKLPMTLDLGAEPGQNGSTVFASLQYDWRDEVASRIRLDYDSQFDSEDMDGVTAFRKRKAVGITLLPYIRYFGDPRRTAKTPLFWVGAGLFYVFSLEDYELHGKKTQKFLTADIASRSHEFGPAIEGGIKFPIGDYFILGYEGRLRPLIRSYGFFDLTADISAFDETDMASKSTNISQSVTAKEWTQPYISQSVFLDILTYFRAKTTLTYYKRLSQSNQSGLTGSESSDSTERKFSWRFGGEVVFPSSNNTRKKEKHLWGGLYYELTWETISENGTSETNRKGRVVICFGK